MARAGKPFSVDTSPTKEIVVNGLTRDATVEACIFDLIDNSIDAARETTFAGRKPEEKQALLESYAGFSIDISLSGDGLTIVDNCGGIPVAHLQAMVLRFGQASQHSMGIGAFGVGLNRALFKLGTISHLRTDTGTQRSELVLKTDDYLASSDWNLPAQEFKSTGNVGTEIEIRKAPEEIAQQFADAEWVAKLSEQVGMRYGRFLAKGIKIKLNNVEVLDREVKIRDNGPYEGEYKVYKTKDGVSIHIRYGQHSEHRFTKEDGYDLERNKSLSGEYGWTVSCNDRAILYSDKSDKTGWETKFHTEFYGFVGSVSFVGPEPAKLPWNTTKTDVDLNNHAYRLALADMRKFAEKWRAIADQRKKTGVPKPLPAKQPSPTVSQPPASPPAPKPPAGPVKKPAAAPPVKKPDYHEFRTILPDDVDELHCSDKHLAIVHEAKMLDLGDHTYAGMALMRMLFEFSVAQYLHRHGKYDELRLAAIARRRGKGLAIAPSDEKNVIPAMDEILPYMDNNSEVWGAKSNQLKFCLKKMINHQSTLNSALHNSFQTFNRAKAFEIRDEVLPLFRHLIET